MTTEKKNEEQETCPAQGVIKLLSGKWKATIFRMAVDRPVRFNTLLREIPGANKQSLSIALRELEDAQILQKNVIEKKPLHIEYSLTEKGRSMIEIFRQLETFAS